MKVLHVITSMDPLCGGTTEAVSNLLRYYLKVGVEPEVVVMDDPDNSPWLGTIKCPVHALGPKFLNYGFSTQLVPWLQSNLPRFDAVVINGLWQYNSFGAWRALRQTPKPYLVFAHGMLDPWFNETYPLKRLKKNLYWPWAQYPVLRDANAVVFITEEERVLAPRSFQPNKWTSAVVGNGTSRPTGDPEAQRRAFAEKFPEISGKRIFLFISRIQEKKGCDLLIQAFAKFAARDPSLHLVMAGPDQTGWVATLKSMSADLGISDRITWTGMISGDMKWGAFRNAEAFILPSHQENFGIAVAEALAMDVPVLISNKVNIWREIDANGVGLVTDDTLQGVEELFEKWLMLDEKSRTGMRDRAALCFDSCFDINASSKKIVDLLTEITGKAGAIS